VFVFGGAVPLVVAIAMVFGMPESLQLLALRKQKLDKLAGWCVVGGQPGLNALSSSFYPTYLRSTGVGAGLGIGRLGAISGPPIAAFLVAQQWSPQQLLWAAAVPALVSTLVIVTLWFVIGPGVKPAGNEAEAVPVAH
jgi:AAHS family 4-hydroxybenzoate transporter-like MFS transporter